MALTLSSARSSTRRALNVPVVIGGQPVCLTAYWNDAQVEVTWTHGDTRIMDVTDLVRVAPHLLPALNVLVLEVCAPQLAHTKLRRMSAAAQEMNNSIAKNSRGRARARVQERNAQAYARRDANPAHGMSVLHAWVADVQVQGVTPDGREWLICGQRVRFEALVERCPDLVPEFLLAARPGLRNFGGFALAVARWVPSVRTHPEFRATRQTLRVAVHAGSGGRDRDHEWVADALAAGREGGKRGPVAPTRPLHNRARHVR